MNDTTLVFLPGWGFKSSIWNRVKLSLNSSPILLCDLPENCKNLNEVIEHLKERIPPQSIIIAWSLSGLIATELCNRYPNLCSKLVLIASTPKFVSENGWPGILPEKANYFLKHAENNMKKLIDKFILLVQYPQIKRENTSFLKKHSLYPNSRTDSLVFYLKLLISLDVRNSYKNLNIPIIYILGESDKIIPAEIKNELTKLNKRTNIHIFSTIGHIPFLTHLYEFILSLTNALQLNKDDSLPTQKIRRSFNKSANSYDNFSEFQQSVGSNLINRIKKYQPQVHNIIDLGCGTGIVTEKIATNFCYKNFYAIDIADQLLIKANHTLRPYGVKIYEKNFQDFHYPSLKFDLVFSNMSLQWSQNLDETFASIYRNLSDNGYLVFSIPLNNTFIEIPSTSRNHFLNRDTINAFLEKFNFNYVDFFEESTTFKFESSLAALKSIKAVGANYTINSPNKLQGKSYLNKFSNSLTYHIGYFIARKAHAN